MYTAAAQQIQTKEFSNNKLTKTTDYCWQKNKYDYIF
jgi:hypothetical protein